MLSTLFYRKNLMQNSSQPFLYINNENEKCLLFCYANSLRTLVFGNEYSIRPWKIRHKNQDTNIETIIETPTQVEGRGEVILECNPHLYSNKLYYTAGFNKGPNTPIIYYLCSLDINPLDPSQTSNFKVIQQTFTGTEVNSSLYYANPNKNGKILKKEADNITEIDIGCIYVYKINKVFNDNKFIITGQSETRPYFSLLFDENLNLIKEIKNSSDEAVYKCSLLNSSLVYTLKLDDSSYESRELVEEVYNG